MIKRQHQLFVTLLCVADALVITAACYAAWAVRELFLRSYAPGYRTWWPNSWEHYVREPAVLLAIPVVLYALFCFGLYRPKRDRSMWFEQGQILKASVVSIAAVVVLLWLLGNQEILRGRAETAQTATLWGLTLDVGRVQIGALALLLPAMLGTHRWVFRMALRAIRRRGWNLRHVAIIGVGRLGRITCQTIDRNSWTGLNVAYFISHKDRTDRKDCLGRPVLGGLEDLEKVLESKRVDAVYLAVPNGRAWILPKILQRLERYPLDVRIVPDFSPRYLPQSMVVNEMDGMPVLSYRESPLQGIGGSFKRVLDVLGAAAGLVALAPLMLLTAALVRLSGPGPIIFKQRRVSLGGHVFKIYKFRTMYHVQDEQAPPAWTTRDDPRITPIGRWLRRTSLDELPQLLNVLKGDMSLVGPRPERPELIERFREDWRGYVLRQHVKAGITGWAQVHGLRGDTSLRKRIQYDLFYIRNWSFWLDLRILALTLIRGFVHRNAH